MEGDREDAEMKSSSLISIEIKGSKNGRASLWYLTVRDKYLDTGMSGN